MWWGPRCLSVQLSISHSSLSPAGWRSEKGRFPRLCLFSSPFQPLSWIAWTGGLIGITFHFLLAPPFSADPSPMSSSLSVRQPPPYHVLCWCASSDNTWRIRREWKNMLNPDLTALLPSLHLVLFFLSPSSWIITCFDGPYRGSRCNDVVITMLKRLCVCVCVC